LRIVNRTTAPKNDAINDRMSKAPLVMGAPPISGVMMNPARKAPTMPTMMFRKMPY
jgi:hypothetical protein